MECWQIKEEVYANVLLPWGMFFPSWVWVLVVWRKSICEISQAAVTHWVSDVCPVRYCEGYLQKPLLNLWCPQFHIPTQPIGTTVSQESYMSNWLGVVSLIFSQLAHLMGLLLDWVLTTHWQLMAFCLFGRNSSGLNRKGLRRLIDLNPQCSWSGTIRRWVWPRSRKCITGRGLWGFTC